MRFSENVQQTFQFAADFVGIPNGNTSKLESLLYILFASRQYTEFLCCG